MKHKLFFLTCIAFLFIMPSVFAEKIYVGDGETYTSINKAVHDASSGDTVIVKDGVYTEYIDIHKPLTLKSENGYTHTTLIYSSDSILRIECDNVIIDGFTLHGSHNSHALSIDGDHCIIRNNRFGIDATKYNKIGIKLYESESTIIINNIFQSNIDNSISFNSFRYQYYCSIVSNVFIGSQHAIDLKDRSYQSCIFRNSFINQLQSPINNNKGSSDFFHSPSEMTYTWNGSQYKSHIGNYYSDFPSSIIDTDENGIIDNFYPMPYSVSNDGYPLMSKACEYKTIAYFLHSNNILSETIDHTYPGKKDLIQDSSILWVNTIPFEKTTIFSSEDHWTGHLSFSSSFYKGDVIQVEIGYSTTGSDFVSILAKTILLNATSRKLRFYLDKQQLTIQSGHYLALKITNQSNRNNSIYTGTPTTYITPPISQATPPAIYEISPNKGSINGGTTITILGLNFGEQQGNVFFDDLPAKTIESWSYTQIVCTSPVHDSGFSTIRVENNHQLSGDAFFKYYFQEESLYVGVEKHFQFIQQAIKYAQAGEKITVYPGIYNESIYVYKTLHLQSKSGADATTIVGKEHTVYVSAKNSTIQGFTIYGSENSSTGVYVAAKNCRVIENRLGVTADKTNDIGINTEDNTLVLNNIFIMNKTGIDLDSKSCSITGNTFISNTKDISARHSSNTICYNSFMNNEERIESYQNIQNAWHSPIPIFYKYKDLKFINYMGNFYKNHDLFDTDLDGITDNNYLLPWTEPEDEFPLTDTIDQYSIFLFSLNNNFQINSFDQMQNESSVELDAGTLMWTMQTDDSLKQLLSQQTVIYGNLTFTEVPEKGAKFRIYTGLTTDGSSLQLKGISEIVADGKKKIFPYQMLNMKEDSISNKQLAFKIKNTNENRFELLVGAFKNCFSIVPLDIDHAALNVFPGQGTTKGGSDVFISGVNFGDTQGNSQILFGDTPVSNYTSWSSTSIICQTPAHESGWVDVSIRRDGLIQKIKQARYLYKDNTIYVGYSQMFSNVQQAVNHAQPFDTILVKSGNYQGNIYIDKPVVLQSESGFTSTTLIAEEPDFDVIKVGYEEITIDGFTIIAASEASAIYIDEDNAVIRNNQCGLNTEQKNSTGIYIQSNNNSIENNILSYNTNSGIVTAGNYNHLSNNINAYNNTGITINGDFNTVISNNCHDNINYGIFIDDSWDRFNSILYNDCRNNNWGINANGPWNIIHANQCVLNREYGIYSYSKNNIFSENICKLNISSGIYLYYSFNNILYLNQLIANEIKNAVVTNDYTNRWYSPVALSYTYKGTSHFKEIGNYYDDHFIWDPNNDGLVDDEEYFIPMDKSGGDFNPLVATIDNYQVDLLFLQPDGTISQNDTILAEIIRINVGESGFWKTFESTVSEIDFTQTRHISGQIYTCEYKKLQTNDQLIVSLGYIDTNDSLVTIADPITFTGDGSTMRFDFQTITQTISSGLNGPLVIKIDNPNDYYVDIMTGSRWSFISMGAISGKIPEPKNDEYIITSGGTLSIEAPGILKNDFNPENSQLIASLKNTTSFGALTLNADGSFTYVNNGSSSATSDQFTYKVNNGYEDSIRTAQVIIQIIHVPVITLTPNQNVTNANMTITIAGNAGSTIEYSLNDGEWQTYSEPVVVTDEGNHNIIARLEDQNQEWLVSQPVSFLIDKTPPEPPILNSNSPQINIQTSVNEIEVTWYASNDLLSDVIGYSYLLDNDADSFPGDNIDSHMLSFTSQPLTMGTYYFHVCAVDSANNVSNPLHVGPFLLGIIPPPPPPSNLKVVKQMDSTVKLEWDYINDYDDIAYHVYRSELSDGLYYRIDTGEHGFYSINNQKVYYTDKDLTNGQSYYYKVKSFWNNLQSEYSNKAFAIPEQAFDFSCHTIDFDSQATWQVSKKVNVKGNVEYHLLIEGSDKFKGEIEASCNEMPDHVSYSFSLNNIYYGPSIHGITLPASFVLSITSGSAAVPGEFQFELSLKNVWEDASSDFMDIPLMLTIKEKNAAGILMDISKQPEPALFDIKKRNSTNENHDIQNVRNRTTETITYKMNQNEAVEIYGEIFPALTGKEITVQLECNNSNFKASTTIITNTEGKFSLANWLSTFDMNEYTLTASWTDKFATTHVSNPRRIIIEKGKPYLTCNSRSNITPQLNERFSISGTIHPAKPKTHVYLLVISPEKEMYNYDLILDENGEYSKTHAFFDRRGIWKIKAYWFGDDTHIGCESPFLIVPVDTSAGRGIILGGGEGNIYNTEFDLVKRLTTEAYKDFRSRGFSDDMIYYAINSQMIDITDNEIPDNIVDNTLPTADSFLYAIENEFVNEVNEEVPLFIYMYGHGTDDGRFIVLGYDEVIEADQLDQALTNIQNETGCVVILILESCYSGKFIDAVSGNKRIILTSTGDSPYKHDFSGDITFSRLLFRQLIRNFSIKYSFDLAKKSMTSIAYHTPLLDDNGDGISDQFDGTLASNYYFKGNITWNFNVTIDENSIQMPYLVSNVKPVMVSAKVIRGDTATETVWANIIPPDADLTASDDLISFQKILFSYNPETQLYEGQLRYLCDTGLYKIVFMARQSNDTMSSPVVKYLTVEHPAVPENIDGNGIVDLRDVIKGLQKLSGFNVMLCDKAETSFGLDDFIKLLQVITKVGR